MFGLICVATHVYYLIRIRARNILTDSIYQKLVALIPIGYFIESINMQKLFTVTQSLIGFVAHIDNGCKI